MILISFLQLCVMCVHRWSIESSPQNIQCGDEMVTESLWKVEGGR